jgi:hypothetical protein
VFLGDHINPEIQMQKILRLHECSPNLNCLFDLHLFIVLVDFESLLVDLVEVGCVLLVAHQLDFFI